MFRLDCDALLKWTFLFKGSVAGFKLGNRGSLGGLHLRGPPSVTDLRVQLRGSHFISKAFVEIPVTFELRTY